MELLVQSTAEVLACSLPCQSALEKTELTLKAKERDEDNGGHRCCRWSKRIGCLVNPTKNIARPKGCTEIRTRKDYEMYFMLIAIPLGFWFIGEITHQTAIAGNCEKGPSLAAGQHGAQIFWTYVDANVHLSGRASTAAQIPRIALRFPVLHRGGVSRLAAPLVWGHAVALDVAGGSDQVEQRHQVRTCGPKQTNLDVNGEDMDLNHAEFLPTLL